MAAAGAGALLLLALPPAAAHADPTGTPAGTGGGCKANGQAVAGNAQDLQPFGGVVSQSTPIAPLNAAFFTSLCS